MIKTKKNLQYLEKEEEIKRQTTMAALTRKMPRTHLNFTALTHQAQTSPIQILIHSALTKKDLTRMMGWKVVLQMSDRCRQRYRRSSLTIQGDPTT